MNKKVEDTTVSICKEMTLAIKEFRGTSSMSTFKEGFTEVSSNTETRFHWQLRGMASKLAAQIIGTDEFDPKKQEIYDVTFASDGYAIGFCVGFKSREKAIRNAVDFAARNGIEVDGYRAKED